MVKITAYPFLLILHMLKEGKIKSLHTLHKMTRSSEKILQITLQTQMVLHAKKIKDLLEIMDQDQSNESVDDDLIFDE